MGARRSAREVEVAASMRPRRVRRGNRPGRRHRPRSLRGFNEAPACPPGKSRRGDGREGGGEQASMRPRRVRRGNLQRACLIPIGPLASMRPRRVRRGNYHVCLPPGAVNDASMRPRRVRRGNVGPASAETWASEPCFNEAPACPPGKSRGWSTPSRCRRGFNEAPACPPGKSASVVVPSGVVTSLQ